MRYLVPLLTATLMLCAGCAEPDRSDSAIAVEGTGEAIAYQNLGTETDYVGAAACASCHEELYLSYQTHGMAQSLYPMTAENAVEDWSGVTLRHEASGFFYHVYTRDGAFYQEEYRLNEAGQKTHQLVRQMDLVVGSGSAARTYLTKEEDRLYQLPLTWYTQKGRWDFSPGYRETNGRFDRTIPARCMACHNAFSEPVEFAEGAYVSLAEGIGCEQCHGPGALHVQARLEDSEPADSIDYTIVNPAHLSIDRQLDVCQQCHLNGTVSILREGRDAFGYRPSEPLAAHVALYNLDAPDSGQISVISHSDRMRQSACFEASAELTCTTCHDPHEGFRTKGPEYFNATCLDCHEPEPLQSQMPTAELRSQHAPEANCFSCHMPKVEAEDAPHSSFTDHYIRVVRAEDRLTGQLTETAGDVQLDPYFPDDANDAEGAVYEGMAYVIFGRQQGRTDAIAKGVARLEAALPKAPTLSEGHYLLGFGRMQLGEMERAIPALEEAVRLKPDIPERLNTLAQAYEAVGRLPSEIETRYQEALRIQPALAEVWVNYGRFLEAQGRMSQAETAYRNAVQGEPWLASAHYNLGTIVLRSGGDPSEAVRHLEQAVELQPDYVDALVNLGIVRASGGDADAAGRLFQRAVDAAPNHPNALSNLGTYHLQRGAFRDAVAVLTRAAAVAPDRADVAAALAAAHFQTGNTTEARRQAERALRIDPGQPMARQVLNALS